MTLEPEDVRTLVDIGFIAWSRGFIPQAAKIFEAVRLVRPNQEAGFIGAALVELHKGDSDRAIELLRKIPPTDTARAFLGVALLKHGSRREARAVLRDVVKHAGDSPVGTMARATLEALAVEYGG